VEVASFGVLEPRLETDRASQLIEERDVAYRKLVLRGRELIGAMFVGNVSNAASLVQTFDRADPLPEDPLEALCSISSGGTAGGGDRTICNCFKVAESTIVACVKDGADTVESVTEQTKAGSGCGSCKADVARLVQLSAKQKLAATG
jgi:nitrite reductase (NADH) large subunit